jgi:DNA-binding HxlR family transcriptional regulator
MKINNKEYVFLIKGKEYHCAMDVTVHFIGGKWKTVILWYLRNGKKRFSELKKLIPNITEKMLSLELKSLEKDNIIRRKVFPVVPPKVEYSLTDFGKTLLPLLDEISKWGRYTGSGRGKMVEKT